MPFAQTNNPVSRFPTNNFTSHSEVATHHPGGPSANGHMPHLTQSLSQYDPHHSTADGGVKPSRVTLQPISESKQ